ncbi:hypothetical protein G6O69_00285 [Pseudenhygromyxa sp. WMMC2535]|uniref:hypothetical protein n=1 Tax=Pseudenhygromyxa sp. WMMC2535 TaxID=2712867 RepID=UPI001552128D|nr:hypothetical protein [Pseudenhygromyxa sp. WMMC2535]NVB36247.1 hypothetical protein [Pseudenhygromyxa sp. WMMC2535]
MNAQALKPTLEYALRPHAVPRDELIRRYRPVMMMVRQILGVVPHAMSYFEIWPPALTTYSVLVPAMLDIPRCDMGRGIPPALRSLVLYVASRSHGCSYCAAHSASVGTVFRGSGGNLARNAQAMSPEACKLFSPADLAAIDYATAAAKLPNELEESHRLGLARHFSEDHEEAIALAVTLMGFLNCAMDTLGMVLEWGVLDRAQRHLAASDWTPGQNFDPRFDQSVVEADKLTDDGQTLGPLELARTMAGIIAYDRGALETIAKRPAKVHEQVREAMGFVPYYVERVERTPAKRVFAHMLVERVQSSAGELPVWLKHAACFAAARNSKNDLLAAHFAHWAMRAGASIEQLRGALMPRPTGGREATAFALAKVASSQPATLGHELLERVTSQFSPPEIIELVTMLSIQGMFQRYVSTYPVDSYESPVADFVTEHGTLLGLPRRPSQVSARWDELCQRARLSAA